jgi:glutamate/tyrosine decarboxylase-like PLP-dependent enzyme
MEGTRPFRGLRIWLPIKILGIQKFSDCLSEKLEYMTWFHEKLKQMDGIEVVTEPEFTIINYRLVKRNKDTLISNDQEIEEWNKKLISAINNKQRVFINSTKLRGKFVIRTIFNCFRTTKEHVELLYKDLETSIQEMWLS